ncbi:gluconate 2-dehydrogenase subunit 3 family protein [Sphingobium sp. H39-3-25]|uniref:gluconate 2-dehydrogenase subunit 3 family protein n=1 Tax=Sphingobium arseniciresistens TaxID=3030834 RepID=UPI0023B890FD|nr:gluconate 2-dehydrogenase subunit 3 family protein [Sphingobium arseniciresistens]
MDELLPVDRRSLIQRLMLLAGASAAGGFSPAVLAQAAARPSPYLSPALFALLGAVADTIIPQTDTPGAVGTRIPATFDALIAHWASPDRRAQLTSALTAIDSLAREKRGMGFAELPPAERLALLLPYDADALKVIPRPAAAGPASLMQGPSYANPGYGKLKELIVILYYISEPALTHELVYEHAPGEWLPSVPVTPETRATGGAGLF